MARITLANKYRPQTFDDVVEQGPIKQILQEQLKTNTHKNCYLFTGGAGTGKTTCARIFAAELNKHVGNPIEIDAASNNGVDNIREIIDGAKFKALDAEYKVYILDEVHMLSIGAWNAMLKLLEEPPAQTIFIMCTTDPQKIPATILSRVQRYDFKRITYDSIVNRLKYICEQEGITPNEEALGYIAKLADGGCRDSISLLDKCLSYNSELTIESVITALGTVDYDTMFVLTNYLVGSDTWGVDTARAISVIEKVYDNGIDLKQFMKQYAYFLLDILKYQLLNDFHLIQIPSIYKTHLDKYVARRSAVTCLLHCINNLNSEIKWATNVKSQIEVLLILFTEETYDWSDTTTE